MKRILPVCAFLILIFAISSGVLAKRSADRLDTSACKLSHIEFDDGDSFSCDGEQIRILGIDAPEIKHSKHGISEDQEKGRKAAEFTKKQLKRANRIVIIRSGRDPYGRTLAHVLLDGELLGTKLIKAGLAYETVSRYGDNGMPEFALEITEAAKVSPKPTFEDPHDWRKKNQKKD